MNPTCVLHHLPGICHDITRRQKLTRAEIPAYPASSGQYWTNRGGSYVHLYTALGREVYKFLYSASRHNYYSPRVELYRLKPDETICFGPKHYQGDQWEIIDRWQNARVTIIQSMMIGFRGYFLEKKLEDPHG